MVTLILQLNELQFDLTGFFQMQEGQDFIEAQLPNLMNHSQSQDWQARKAAIQAIMMLIRATRHKESLMQLKPDLIEVLNPLKSDKFKPVREIACECLN